MLIIPDGYGVCPASERQARAKLSDLAARDSKESGFAFGAFFFQVFSYFCPKEAMRHSQMAMRHSQLEMRRCRLPMRH